MESLSKLIFLIILNFNFKMNKAEKVNQLIELGEEFQHELSDITYNAARWLEDFNDRHLGRSVLGRILHYEDLKPKLSSETERRGKNMKKMGMAMIPLIFHVGASSTWMLLTSIMAAKSVAIGLALLVFKIAVSSAKVASFFTTLKAKHDHPEYSWTPHTEHHGHYRGLSGTYYPADWNSYTPEMNDVSPPYKTIPAFKHSESFKEYSEESKSSHS